MTEPASAMSREQTMRQSVWRRHWWVIAMVVLVVLVGIIYVLAHLSAADSEMYPTTKWLPQQYIERMC